MTSSENLQLEISRAINNDVAIEIDIDKELLLKIRITSDEDTRMLNQCSVRTLVELKEQIVAVLRARIRDDIYLRVSFHKGSLIILIAISAATLLVINTPVFQYIKEEIGNIVSKVFHKISNIIASIDLKMIRKGLDILADALSIGKKLLSIFSGEILPPLPPDIGSDGWTTI